MHVVVQDIKIKTTPVKIRTTVYFPLSNARPPLHGGAKYSPTFSSTKQSRRCSSRLMLVQFCIAAVNALVVLRNPDNPETHSGRTLSFACRIEKEGATPGEREQIERRGGGVSMYIDDKRR